MRRIGSLCVKGPVAVVLLFAVTQCYAAFYSHEDPLVSIVNSPKSFVLNSDSFWMIEVYAEWCGHCSKFRAKWLDLARDIQDWRPVVYLGVLNCGQMSNSDACTEFNVPGYPTLKIFKPFTKDISEAIQVQTDSVPNLRHNIIDILEEQKESNPTLCPPFEPISVSEIKQFFSTNTDNYLALIFEELFVLIEGKEEPVYLGREVALDMVQYKGVSVRRVLKQQSDVVNHFMVSSFPSLILMCQNGSVSTINLTSPPTITYITFFSPLASLLHNATEVSSQEFEDVLNNKDQAVLASSVNFVWCQGSKSQYRGFPCSLWTLFHFLTVQASELYQAGQLNPNPREVLLTLRSYVEYFFGCRECAMHFERMAAESMLSVQTLDEAITWLWDRHNRGENEDPKFPKVPWPTEDLCPSCRIKDGLGEPEWNMPNVLMFLKSHFSKQNLVYDYLEDEEVLLQKQRASSKVENRRDTSAEETNKNKIIDNVIENNPDKASDGEKEATNIVYQNTNLYQESGVMKADPKQQEVEDEKFFAHSLLPRRSLQESNRHRNRPGVQSELVIDLPDEEFDHIAARKRLLKRGIDSHFIGAVLKKEDINSKVHWVKMLGMGFSRLDISLCVLLYFLSIMCLLAMYLYMNFRTRSLRQKAFNLKA
ncbi:hypothetical protein GDO86_007760 [Hymenochirus boettgeri]|uniref:Sulfhydryl oxidase n=1 Tax=Hymenochirus boettgeri TaxID=247094 RepID=A0A8T2J351_9PIPI|nr:hypothetical protein GDO86_007760 [Hymenochirus boettgeri]